MKIILFCHSLLLGIFAPASVNAGQSHYECVPKHALVLDDEGVLKTDKVFERLSKPFVVDRKNGRVYGGLLDNDGMQILMTDGGSTEQSFKIHARTTTKITHAMYLQVNEFMSGKRKPFMGIRSPNSVVITGFCE
jgi:hypothetical protein